MQFSLRTDSDRVAVKGYLDRLPTDKVYDITIVRHKEKRSLDQNALYFKWVGIVAREVGEDNDTIHKIFARKFLGWDVVEIMGEKIARIKSTSKLPMKEFAEYMQAVEAFVLNELDIVLPHPEDLYYDKM